VNTRLDNPRASLEAVAKKMKTSSRLTYCDVSGVPWLIKTNSGLDD
jgi:hypothetical protein